MTDDEKLRNAGWSPNSLSLAFDVFESPPSLKQEKNNSIECNSTNSKVNLKRHPYSIISTPKSHNQRESKMLDQKTTPIIRSRSCTIDLTSTAKKSTHSPLSASFTEHDDVTIMTNNFRRQSIEPSKTKDCRPKTKFFQVERSNDENVKPKSLNLMSDDNKTKQSINHSEILTSSNPLSIGIDIKKNNSFHDNKSSNNGFNSNGETNLLHRDKISNSAVNVPSAIPLGTQMERLLLAANLDAPLRNGWKLFQHQKDAVTDCLKLGRTIMAFDMGLGKTLISLIWAKSVCTLCPDCTTVVIVPCTLIEIWNREAEMIGFEIIQTDERSKTSKALKQRQISPKAKISVHSWAKIPSLSEINSKFVLIADEAHAMQSITSIRTKAILDLCLHKSCLGIILSTGTPMKNGRPANILPLLIGIRHPIAGNKIEFEKRYCNAQKTKFCAWDVSGASNLEELRSSIGPHLMRKTKEECLDLPPLIRKIIKLEISDTDNQEYENIINTMRKKSKMKYAQQKQSSDQTRNSSCLEMMSQLRMFSSKAKVTGTVELVKEKLKVCRDPIVLFVWFKETGSKLLAALTDNNLAERPMIRCELLTGDIIKHQMRQEMVDRFQMGMIDVLICTFGVGSTGITLTRSHTVILLDRPWTPGDTAQAEDRVRRIGQKSDTVESIWIEAFELDKKLDSMLEKKAKNTAKVISSELDQRGIKDLEEIEEINKLDKSKPTKIVFNKTVTDYFASGDDKTKTECGTESNVQPVGSTVNELNFGVEEDSRNEDQMSVMQSLLRHIMKG